MKIFKHGLCALLAIFMITGCAKTPKNPEDPYERYNRRMFQFDTFIDKVFLKPAAVVYVTIIPRPVRGGVTNFFNNVQLLITFPNDILQGKFHWAAIDFWRFVINSTFGIGGLFDIATRVNLPRHYQDFGLTMAYWSGNKETPYFVLPFLGPSTIGRAFCLPVDYAATPWAYMRPTEIMFIVNGIYATNIRSNLLDADKLVANSFDPYIFVRNAYMQNRRQLVANNARSFPRQRHQGELPQPSAQQTENSRVDKIPPGVISVSATPKK